MSNSPPRKFQSRIFLWKGPNKEDIEEEDKALSWGPESSALTASSILLEASRRTFWRVTGLQSFLRALYTTLLPKTLREHEVTAYSLLWYPARCRT